MEIKIIVVENRGVVMSKNTLKIVYFYEEKYYSREMIMDKIGPTNFKNTILQIEKMGVIKYEQQKGYKFCYVGILINRVFIDCNIFVVLPKYLKDAKLIDVEKVNYARLLIKLFKKYTSEKLIKEELETLGNDFDLESHNIISLIDLLIRDYLDYGLYSNEYYEFEYNGNGEIDWNETIGKNAAFVSNGQVLYLDYYSLKLELNKHDYIRNLHKYILNMCYNFISQIKIFDVFDYPQIKLLVNENIIGNIEFMLHMIENEMQLQFSERKIRLLRAMQAFLREQSFYSNEKLIFFGSKSFHKVWEKACSFVIGNEYDKYKKIIKKPIWKSVVSTHENCRDTLIPDIVKKIDDNFFIFDAKYYNIIFDSSGKLKGRPPGIGDIIKQYAYDLAFSKKFKKRFNIFLFPTSNDTNQIIGSVSLSFFEEQNSIKVIKLSAKGIFEKYIDNFHFSNDEIIKITGIDSKSKY